MLNQNKNVYLDPYAHFMGPYKKNAMSMMKNQFLYGGRSSMKTSRHVTRMVVESILTPRLWSWAIAKESTKLDTGLQAEFIKVIERVTDGKYVRGRDFRVLKRPAEIEFNNGSRIIFGGSTMIDSIKGRSLPGLDYRWGFVLFDEFATYKKGDELYKAVKPTLIRNDYKGPWNHPFWEREQLDLDEVVLDEHGEPVYITNEFGEREIKIKKGRHADGVIFLFAMNPPQNKYHWVYDFIEYMERRNDTYIEKINYTHVRNELAILGLHSVITEAEEERRTNFESYQHVWLGIPTATDGLFFKSYDPHAARIEYLPIIRPEHWAIGVDSGYNDATTFVLMGLSGEELIIAKMYYHMNTADDDRGATQYSRDFYEFVQQAKRSIPGLPRTIPVFVDPAAKGLRNDLKFVLRERRSNDYKVYKAVNDREKTVGFLYDLVSSNRLRHLPVEHHLQLEKEISMAETKPNSDDFVKGNDHLIDATRYVAYKLKKHLERNRRREIYGG